MTMVRPLKSHAAREVTSSTATKVAPFAAAWLRSALKASRSDVRVVAADDLRVDLASGLVDLTVRRLADDLDVRRLRLEHGLVGQRIDAACGAGERDQRQERACSHEGIVTSAGQR